MYYHEQQNGREKQLTRDFVCVHQSELCRILDLHSGDKVVVELQKKRYGREGDVDIAVWKNPLTAEETFVAVEVKCMFLDSAGAFKSEKKDKHHKQIGLLEKEGWDLVYFFDFIVTEPVNSWFHPQAFEGYDQYKKEVESDSCGHVVFQINAVAGKPESMGGSISHKILQSARAQKRTPASETIKEAFASLDFSMSAILIDVQ